jgi:tetratricopeptide (TPR) repeat protein
MALAMQEAHRRGVIHRDLKSANVMIDRNNQPVIMDFGLARRGLDTGDVRLTRSGMIMGTPGYMSPEQVNGDSAIGPACDIYSLGVILYELLTGRLPFTGALGELLVKITSEPPPPPSQLRPGLDPELDTICLKALAKKPVERFGSMQEFAQALEFGRQPKVQQLASKVQPPPASGNARNVFSAAPASDIERLYLAAQYYLERRSEESHRKSIATYTQILDLDPTHAPAWAGLAFAYHLLSVCGYVSPTNANPRAKSAVVRALSLDNSLAKAHSVLATIMNVYDWDLAGAKRAFQRALELKPSDATTHQLYGKCLACRGEHDAAIAALRRAEELDPLSPILSTSVGRHGYLLARRYDEAVRQYHKTLEIDPNFWLTHRFLAWAYLLQGKLTEAICCFVRACELSHDDSMTLAGLGHAYALAGQQARAIDILDTLTQRAQQKYETPDCAALVHLGLRDSDQTFACLDKCLEDRSEGMCKIKVDPVLDPLRTDPRFDALVQRMNIKI